jgi:protein-S-isoprenylcysteine O-methyltransferase Ste14
MDTTYLILIILFVLSLATRTSYEILKDAGKINPESKLIFALIFAIMCILWTSWFMLCLNDPFKVELPFAIKWTGIFIFFLGVFTAIGALLQLRGLENIKHLVKNGLFTKIRHPMYLGFILWIFGWSIYHGAIVSLAIGLIGIANIIYWRRLEEARLLLQFGDKYQEYKMKTWF